jgi:polyphosphate kinase
MGVKVDLIIRGIYCAKKILKKKEVEPHAISIVDEFLEHARVLIFHNNGDSNVFISSADWMIRNLDHRLEVACPVNNIQLKTELLHLMHIQLKDNVKARVLNSQFHNNYVPSQGKGRFRSQQEIYRLLSKK